MTIKILKILQCKKQIKDSSVVEVIRQDRTYSKIFFDTGVQSI